MFVRVRARVDFIGDGHEVIVDIGDKALQREGLVDRLDGGLRQPLLSGPDGTQFLQEALETAWRLGLRPLGYDDTTAALKATQGHLSDMRRIALKQLDIAES